MAARKLDEARKAFTASAERPDDAPVLRAQEATFSLREGDPAAAERRLRAILNSSPADQAALATPSPL